MWTYREIDSEPKVQPSAVSQPKETESFKPEKREYFEKPKQPEPFPKPKTKQKHRYRTEKYMGGIYLCGLTAGSVCTSFLGEQLLQYAQYFTSSSLKLYRSGNTELLFSTQFLAAFVQLSIVCVLGYGILGKWLLPVLLFTKGVGTGCFWAQCIAELGFLKGFFSEAVIFLMPEVISVAILIGLSSKALQISAALWNCCKDRICPLLKQQSKQLLYAYLISCLAALFPSALSVLLIQSFGKICGLL